ncbi:protein-disulfide reductase DsbD family protein [Candidatus Kirkpatrickella diaphorinae]|uniref:Protein-disulfide reductase DsbD family protein n=1 Tax=Candidatus Kirkpatrickella diaphorinae TaxID=2984322 RepID=A0ABY6GJX7_9PROT|nr:protein-disulfide reductase DsbD domain-containing protein [Candidatus Kirkpatrickella diaphorinae]UYH51115.1 protein-disulfide reductase DsbD family protein [Candidatus Kirkpatrickella diaphorinae]
MKIFKFWLPLIVLGLILTGQSHIQPARAAVSVPLQSAHDTATLITDHDALGPDQTLNAAIRLQLQPGWHTYWKNPGDAGEATSLTVTLSGERKGSSDQIKWPTPAKIPESGLMAYGYEGDVVLPVTLRATGVGPATLQAHAEWLVCANTCVPEKGDFTLTLPAASSNTPEGQEAPLFHRAAAQTPRPSPFRAGFDKDGVLTLQGEGLDAAHVASAWFMPDRSGVIDQLADQNFRKSGDSVAIHLTWATPAAPPADLSGVIVLEGSDGRQRAYELAHVHPSIEGMKGAPVTAGHATPWLKAMIFAFIAGLILNLMPCVFPVLAMKALSLIKMAGAARHAQRRSALFYAVGVIGAFLALAALTLILRAGGTQVGWGFQFQSPLFVITTMWLLFLLALNLFSVFEITPGAIDVGAMTRLGASGDIITGVLAVILATPCTAPFMGTALAVALTAPFMISVVIFVAMGVGLACPYVLIACFPALGRFLPRPGAWMAVLKQLLAFPLLASCVWLLWVATVQGGAFMTLLAASGAVTLGLAAWLYGISQRQKIRGARGLRRFNLVIALILVLATVMGVVWIIPSSDPPLDAQIVSARQQSGDASFDRQKWSPEVLAEKRAAQKPVFVDMTASWCITCLVNDRVALSTSSVRKAFAARGVTMLVGDWTNKDDRITAYLRLFGRDGVPLYVYYKPGGEGVVLPQILTPGIVIKAISDAPHP